MLYQILSDLINGAILAGLLTAVVWLVLYIVPRRILNAATRYVIWWVALTAAIAIPFSFLPSPKFHRADPPFPMNPVLRVSRPVSPQPYPFAPSHAQPDRPTSSVLKTARPEPAPAAGHFSRKSPAIVLSVNSAPWPRWLILLWPVISLLLLARLVMSLVMLNRLKARAQPAPAILTPRIRHWLAQCGGSRKGIHLAISHEIATPIAAGPRNPAILIPAHLLKELTEDDLDRIGLHETAHLVRRDDYALVLQRALEALCLPYPLIYWIARRIDLEREIACDDLVIAATGLPRSYAACLTRIVESADGAGSPWPAATAAEDTSQLARRVDALLDKTRRVGAHLMKAPLAAITAMLVALAFVAAKAPLLIAFVATATPSLKVNRVPIRHGISILPQAVQALPAPSPDPIGAAAGQVLEDNSGNPVASAELRFHRPGLPELAADLETDRQGRFSAPDLPPGNYRIEVSKPNYVNTTFRISIPSPRLTVRLVRYGVIDGQATDTAGRPLPGVIRAPTGRAIGSARVTVLTRNPVSGELRVFREATLEDGGRYRVYDLPPGQYAVGLWYAGQNEGSGMQLYPDNSNPRSFLVSGGEEFNSINFVVTPRPAAQISGTVEMPDGAKGQFQLALGLPEQPTLPIAQTLSEKDGSFRFEKVPPGNYDVFVAGPVGGYGAFDSVLAKGDVLFGRTRLQVSGQNIANLQITVGPARSLHVVLHARGSGSLPEGCPASANVTLTSLEPWAILYFSGGQTGFGKDLTIPNLAPGKFRITATELGDSCFQANDAVVDLSRDSLGPATIELVSAGSVRGLLRGDASGTVVVLMDSRVGEGAQARIAYPDSTGHFGFENLPPARYRIASYPAARAPRGRWVSGTPRGKEIDVAGGAPTEVELVPSSEGGRPE